MCLILCRRFQALELRKSCECPALPLTDPRAVFSETVRVLLEKAKQQEGGGLGAAHQLQPASVPAEPPAPQNVLPPPPGGDQLNKGWDAALKQL